MRRRFAAVVLALLPMLVPGFAAADNVYEVNTTGATATGSKNNGGVYIGQAFNSGTNTLLTSASLQINREGLAEANFTLNLRLATGSPGSYLATGSSLASLTFSNSILSTTTGAFHTFNPINWTLTPNTVYLLGIASESTATVKWTLNQSVTQNSSTGFITGYSGYNAEEGGNVDNGLHGATITAVPEPSAAALSAIVGLCVLGWCRRSPGR